MQPIPKPLNRMPIRPSLLNNITAYVSSVGRFTVIPITLLMMNLGVLLSGAELPESAQKILRGMEIEIAKDRAKAVKSLEAEQAKAMKANDLDGALAIRAAIDEQSALIPKTEAELEQGPALRRMAGRRIVSGHTGDYWLFRPDGTFDSSVGNGGTWEVKEGKVIITTKTRGILVCTVTNDDLWIEEGRPNRWERQK